MPPSSWQIYYLRRPAPLPLVRPPPPRAPPKPPEREELRDEDEEEREGV